MPHKAIQQDFADNPTHSGPPDNTANAVGTVGAEHSANNILLWKLYLPSTCIASMIAMGWDRTT
jgi:hypothetical protein